MILKLNLIIIIAVKIVTAVAFDYQDTNLTVVQLVSSLHKKDSQTNVTLVSDCISLKGFTEYDKNVKSIQIYHLHPCVKLYPTYDCTDVSMRIQTQLPLILMDNGKTVSSIGRCDAKECPPGFQEVTGPSRLLVDFEDIAVSDLKIEIHPNECLRFPRMHETHFLSLSILDSKPNDCIEIYELEECQGKSTQITLTSELWSEEFFTSSFSLCDYKCRFNTTIYRFVYPGESDFNEEASGDNSGVSTWKIVITLLISTVLTGCIVFFLIKTFCMKKVTRIVRLRFSRVPIGDSSGDDKSDKKERSVSLE